MKELHLRIKSCSKCPYFLPDAIWEEFFCNKANKSIIDFKEYYTIEELKDGLLPDWCPLPDVKEKER